MLGVWCEAMRLCLLVPLILPGPCPASAVPVSREWWPSAAQVVAAVRGGDRPEWVWPWLFPAEGVQP